MLSSEPSTPTTMRSISTFLLTAYRAPVTSQLPRWRQRPRAGRADGPGRVGQPARPPPAGPGQRPAGRDLGSLADRDPAAADPAADPGRAPRRPPGLAAACDRFEADLGWLPERARVLREPVPVRLTERLQRLRDQVRADLAGRAGAPAAR